MLRICDFGFEIRELRSGPEHSKKIIFFAIFSSTFPSYKTSLIMNTVGECLFRKHTDRVVGCESS